MNPSDWLEFGGLKKTMPFFKAVSLFRSCVSSEDQTCLKISKDEYLLIVNTGGTSLIEITSCDLRDDSLLASVSFITLDRLDIDLLVFFLSKNGIVDDKIKILGRTKGWVQEEYGNPDYVVANSLEYVREDFSVEFLFDIGNPPVCGYISLLWH